MGSPCSQAGPDGPPAAELGRRGLACVQRYETDGDEDALTQGIAHLEEAVAAAPGHPDRTRWWYALGSGYEGRAEAHGTVDDYDRAIGWYRRLHDGLPDGPDRWFVALVLTGAQWSRYWLVRYGGGPVAEPGALVTELLAALARWPAPTEDPAATAYAHMVRGLAHHERYDLHRDPVDLDRALVLLAGSVPGLPDDTPWLAVAAFTLAVAYWDRYVSSADVRMLDLAVEAADRALRLTGEEHPAWLSAHEHRAVCLSERWRRGGPATDLDDAIGAARVALRDDEDGCVAALAGELLRERAQRAADPGDAVAAVVMLERAVAARPDPARRLELARAHRARWVLGRAAGSLEAGERHLAEVIAAATAGDPVVEDALAELAAFAELRRGPGDATR